MVIIKQSFNKSKPLLWLPAPDNFEIELTDKQLPPDFMKLLNFFVYGNANVEMREKPQRIVLYIRQVGLMVG